ncbi:precorrin-8X methylmutase [Cyanobium sp. HWJ4-Hawea]|uniref:precorrin-8X methylmutase n=1 Tax=Cyanobium sp. HWJ4-Hawea TaxID=2823713 RepID=UPI0020CD9B5F|nr:precorrin-8X methylmutase [Cyanobium sp. HWJ4-Hawea]MCP9810278.1 precorrin-8X methylmutase [Cyanobium sp. HWJ4-Hawea]
MAPQAFDHPIFSESIALIRSALAQEPVDLLAPLSPLESDVLLRLIHSSGDLSLANDLQFSPGACEAGAAALAAGAVILTDTAMAAAAVAPMARRTFANRVASVLDWAPAQPPAGSTRTAAGMALALADLGQVRLGGTGVVVLIGSAPTALERLLELVAAGACPSPALVVGMPVGFVGVEQSKRHLGASGLVHLGLGGSKGGAGLVAAACNALLRHGFLAAAEQA